MGLWRGRPGRERRDVRGERVGMGRDGRRREKQRRKKNMFLKVPTLSLFFRGIRNTIAV